MANKKRPKKGNELECQNDSKSAEDEEELTCRFEPCIVFSQSDAHFHFSRTFFF